MAVGYDIPGRCGHFINGVPGEQDSWILVGWRIWRGGLDPADISALGWPGRVFAPGEWGSIVNGGAWLTVGGVKVDLIYRDLDEVLRWTAAAQEGRFEIRREVGYVAGIATYILAGELALGRVLAGELPRPASRLEPRDGVWADG